MSAEIPRIQYEDLVRAYHESLTTKLRGFRSADQFEFLETWVPDDEPCSSLLNLLEAAKDGGAPGLVILVNPDTFRALDADRLAAEAVHLGRVRVDRIPTGAAVAVTFGPEEEPFPVHPAYQDHLRRLAGRSSYERSLEEGDGLCLAQADEDGIRLMVLADPASHLVRAAAYQGRITPVQRGLLEGLCELLVNRPLQEGSDHAVLRLEKLLRDPRQPAPVPGVVTPLNADPAFALPVRLIRGALADYRRRTGHRETENTYDPPTAPAWRVLSKEDQAAKLTDTLRGHPAGAGVDVVRVETPQRVVVQFTGAVAPERKPRQLRELEAHVRQVLEPSLQLYLQPKSDENKPRQTKGVQG